MPELIVTKDIDVPGINSLEVYSQHGGYQALAKALREYQPDDLVELIKKSGLRGRGGAGFPTGMKWSFLAKNDKPRYLCCNADESEPGTIKDRFIMETVPHLVIEGMITAGLVTGAHQGILYIRHEYDEPKKVLQTEIEHCYQSGLLGKRILGSDLSFDLEIFVSPGGYICGEESALLEAIEGKSTREMSLAQIRSMLTGEPGSNVNLSVVRARRSEPQKVVVTRDIVTIPPVKDKMPLLLAHGDADTVVSIDVGRRWAKTATDLKMKDFKYMEIPGADHGTVITQSMPAIFKFFQERTK